jgi:hypothetical protein
VPFEVISATWPADTCLRKYGLYGTRTREGACVAREPAQKLKASSASAKTIHATPMRGRRGLPLGFDGVGDPGGLVAGRWFPPLTFWFGTLVRRVLHSPAIR